ncbi:hypothetical protein [Mycolicibacterium vaccae]|uniref:Uncharacterized protein n=1 Tax=Mycolicibacterium vaccae ATCC 25954 TaxID=1194972 RepID=K0UQP5_MYCVA|nr:hypothetical protein [Mycolicibacterium vaccae]ANI38700.1 hypothetical protein MYVA_1494 [Mycolicibacterium vaccae 95051]EJZ07345.1 hypothetical protein MVAC_18951 [Mycolicibacterium vaccae ATCC 25954]
MAAESTVDHLITCLKSASQRFDQGRHTEVKPLAGHLRALLYRSDGSDALQGLRDTLTWVDTAGVPNPKTACSIAGLTLMRIRSRHHGAEEYVPKLAMYPPAPIRTRDGDQIFSGSRIPFEHWWTNPVLMDSVGAQYSRKELVLAMAALDDRDARSARRALARSASLGWVVRDAPAARLCSSPVVASVRQIGYEVMQSLAEQREILDAVR